MNSIAPWHPCRSEAFAEDLFGDSTQVEPAQRDNPARGPRVLNTLLLCAVPLVVALLGGVVAFLQTV
jgi:hypothetical protein